MREDAKIVVDTMAEEYAQRKKLIACVCTVCEKTLDACDGCEIPGMIDCAAAINRTIGYQAGLCDLRATACGHEAEIAGKLWTGIELGEDLPDYRCVAKMAGESLRNTFTESMKAALRRMRDEEKKGGSK